MVGVDRVEVLPAQALSHLRFHRGENDMTTPASLGRRPSPPDPRDYKLADYLAPDPLTALWSKVNAQTHTKEFKAWGQALTAAVVKLHPPAPVPPTPPPATRDVVWTDSDVVLDQGQTPHCVGFGWAQFGNTNPINDAFSNADGDKIYYECKQIDGEPGAEDGSDVRSGAKAFVARKRIAAYAFAASVDEARAWIANHGPVVVGSDWTNDMFNPDTFGVVRPTGGVAGGHCYVLVGDLVSEGHLLFQNSWSDTWGVKGQFKMTYQDFANLLQNQGELCVAVELP